MNPTVYSISPTVGHACRRGFSILGVSRLGHFIRLLLASAMLGLMLALDAARVPTIFICAAGSKSDYLELKVLDHVLGGSDYTRVATVYIALFTVTPSDAGGGTECTGGGYARLAVTNNATNFPAASAGSKTNGTTFSFTTFSGSVSAGAAFVAWGIFDASTSGNLLYWGSLAAGDQKVYTTNDQFTIPSGSLTITED